MMMTFIHYIQIIVAQFARQTTLKEKQFCQLIASTYFIPHASSDTGLLGNDNAPTVEVPYHCLEINGIYEKF